MNKLTTSIFATIILSGCSEYKIPDGGRDYPSQQEAAVSWYKDNLPIIKGLSTEQELLGWVLKCDDIYRYTNYVIGGVRNSVSPPSEFGCTTSALLHTHPHEPHGGSYDYFSQGDLATSWSFPIYLFTLEKCHIRVADNKGVSDNIIINPYGKLLGKIHC